MEANNIKDEKVVCVNQPMKHITTELKIPSPQVYLLNACFLSSEKEGGVLGSLNGKYFKEIEELMVRFASDVVACAVNNINAGNEFSIGKYLIESNKRKRK